MVNIELILNATGSLIRYHLISQARSSISTIRRLHLPRLYKPWRRENLQMLKLSVQLNSSNLLKLPYLMKKTKFRPQNQRWRLRSNTN